MKTSEVSIAKAVYYYIVHNYKVSRTDVMNCILIEDEKGREANVFIFSTNTFSKKSNSWFVKIPKEFDPELAKYFFVYIPIEDRIVIFNSEDLSKGQSIEIEAPRIMKDIIFE